VSTVLSIVEQNHGQIEVESEPGRGSAFFIHLPWASKDTASESEASSSPNDTETQITAQYPVGVALAQD
jgi:hypothetical protein